MFFIKNRANNVTSPLDTVTAHETDKYPTTDNYNKTCTNNKKNVYPSVMNNEVQLKTCMRTISLSWISKIHICFLSWFALMLGKYVSMNNSSAGSAFDA